MHLTDKQLEFFKSQGYNNSHIEKVASKISRMLMELEDNHLGLVCTDNGVHLAIMNNFRTNEELDSKKMIWLNYNGFGGNFDYT